MCFFISAHQVAGKEAASLYVVVRVVLGQLDELVDERGGDDEFSQAGRRKENRSRLQVAVEIRDFSELTVTIIIELVLTNYTRNTWQRLSKRRVCRALREMDINSWEHYQHIE